MENSEYTLKNLTATEKKSNWTKYLVEYDEDTLRNFRLPSTDSDDTDTIDINVSEQ